LHNIWTGNILLIEPLKYNFVSQFSAVIKQNNFEITTFILLLFSYFINHQTRLETDFFYFLSSLIGLYFSIEIFKAFTNSSLSKFCNENENYSCNSIIGSKKEFGGLKFADMPIVYFSTSLFFLIVNISKPSTIGLISLLVTPVIIYSIYLQKRSFKKWVLLIFVWVNKIKCILRIIKNHIYARVVF